MAEPQAGWYPDPSGDVTRLRYWDGTQWTESFMQNPHAPASESGAQASQANNAGQQPTSAAQQPTQAYMQPGAYQTGTSASQQPQYGQAPQSQYVHATFEQTPYSLSREDHILRLIAFIFCILSLASSCWLIVPLAWMIPMCVVSWRIYKGTRPNTVAFGVCTLIFVSVVAGILLLVSTKER